MTSLVPSEVRPDEVYLEGVGANRGEPPPRYQVELAMAWIWLHTWPTEEFNRTKDSYALKHLAERGCEQHGVPEGYLSNGAFILAALELGYRAIRASGPNAFFNMDWNTRCRRGPDLPEGF